MYKSHNIMSLLRDIKLMSRDRIFLSHDKYRGDHYHKENKTNGGKQIEFSAESNQFEKKSKVGINEMFSNC